MNTAKMEHNSEKQILRKWEMIMENSTTNQT